MQVKNAMTARQDVKLKILVYGQSGVGKTVFAAGFPKPVFLCAEQGMLSVAGKDIDYIDVVTPEEIEEAYQYLVGPKARAKYDTVVVDSITAMQNLVYMPAILKAQNRLIPEIRDWGQLLENMRRFSKQVTDLPYKNIVFICLEEEREIEEGNWVTRPSMTGKFANELPAYVDVVMRLVVDSKRVKVGEDAERTRLAIFQPARNFVAKDRSDALPVAMKDPTADKVMAVVRGSKPTVRKRVRKTPKED